MENPSNHEPTPRGSNLCTINCYRIASRNVHKFDPAETPRCSRPDSTDDSPGTSDHGATDFRTCGTSSSLSLLSNGAIELP
jgi:hypothetical protein